MIGAYIDLLDQAEGQLEHHLPPAMRTASLLVCPLMRKLQLAIAVLGETPMITHG